MKQFTIIADDFRHLEEGIADIPNTFCTSGKTIYSGRNVVKSFQIDGCELIVKHFKPCNIFRSIGYLFRGSKASRAYLYGKKFLEAGIDTPAPVAYIEFKSGPFVRDAYFISLPNYAQDLVAVLRHRDFDIAMAGNLARFLVELHSKGILHGDLNLSNILWDADHFVLIDTNRTKFVAKPSRKQILNNLIRLTYRRDLLRTILSEYASISALPEESFVVDGLKALFHREYTKHLLHKITFRK